MIKKEDLNTMRAYKQFLLFYLIIFVNGGALAQNNSVGKIKYTPDFKFKDGIFLSFEQVKTNDPIPKSKIITTTEYNDEDFFDRVLSDKEVSFYNSLGEKRDVEVRKLWGYSRNGTLYINIGGEFQRITIVGKICHLVANVTVYDNIYYDPYYYRYYNSYYYSPRGQNVSSNELKQFILDFDTGRLVDYTVKNLEVILMRDTELYDKYNDLRKKKKKQLKFMYIRKYNERNPLYIIQK